MEISINHHKLKQQIYKGAVYLKGIDIANSFLCDSIYELFYRDAAVSSAISKAVNVDSEVLYITYDARVGCGQIADGDFIYEFELRLDQSDMHLIHSIDDRLLQIDEQLDNMLYAM